ncbi:MAG TPA: ABC transporter permease [Gaiellaceae bacterium]|nr:ABC transporter permease [Gaiellaceae bacterium]
MTNRAPGDDTRAQDREDVPLDTFSVGQPASAQGNPGAIAVPEQPIAPLSSSPALAMGHSEFGDVEAPAADLIAQQAGVEPKARSQWAYARIRFFRHRMAVVSLVVLFLICLVAIFAKRVAPYAYDELDLFNTTSPPTTKDKHLFGTDLLGRDYLSRVIFGLRTSLWVAFFVAFLSTAIGTTIGSLAGYYGGAVDNLLMRFTDLILTLPGLAVLLTAATFFGNGDPLKIGLILALLLWTVIARIVRGVFLSLREKEYVEAAKASGAGDARIILRHMLPNALGPIIVNTTLIIAAAILIEAALSFLGFGIQPPNPSLGTLIDDGQGEGFEKWWLVTFPGLVIVVIALAINFIGDGLRDALDPTQRRVRA